MDPLVSEDSGASKGAPNCPLELEDAEPTNGELL